MPNTLAPSDSLLVLPGTCHQPEDKPKALAAQWVAQPLVPAGQGVGRSLVLGPAGWSEMGRRSLWGLTCRCLWRSGCAGT